MCLIVDANMASRVFCASPGPDAMPVLKALVKRRTFLVAGGRLSAEYAKLRQAQRFIAELQRTGLLRLQDARALTIAENHFKRQALVSNDPHILALAHVSGARVLCSHDQKLHQDFTNRRLLQPPGRVYQVRKHRHLLRDACVP
jgi:predicted nucleic acid-binding protein